MHLPSAKIEFLLVRSRNFVERMSGSAFVKWYIAGLNSMFQGLEMEDFLISK